MFFHDIADPQAQRQEHGNAADATADCTVDEPKHSERRTAAGTLKGDANMRANASGITVSSQGMAIDDRWLI
jgi:hypothetical protein